MSHLLPPNATPQERALSLATGRAVPVPIKTLWRPETCPDGILPWLAWALSVGDWDATWTIERKRQAVAESIEVHRHKGTIGALRRALEQLGYEVEIDEKTGEAYTFRLNFKVGSGSAGGALLEDAVTRATDIAIRQKNARSELIGTRYLAENGDTGGPIIAGTNLSGSETDVTEFSGPNGPPSLVVTGTLSVSFPTMPMAAPHNYRPNFAYPLPNGATSCKWEVTGTPRWVLQRTVPAFPGPFGIYQWVSYDDVASPDLASTWTPQAVGAFPAPTGDPVLNLVY